MRSWLLMIFGVLIAALIGSAVIYTQKIMPPSQVGGNESHPSLNTPVPIGSPSGNSVGSPLGAPTGTPSNPNQPAPTLSQLPSPGASGATSTAPDLTVDSAGLSKATVVMTTSAGIVKFKFFPNDAHQTVERVIELIQKGFYNGLTFHRVVPGFVVQGGDPVGNGTGGSGQKLKAEFNNRRHVEGTLAMARGADPNSADSQFYISLGTLPHLDHNYTVFGQVVEGMDVVRNIKAGDKMITFVIQ